MTTLLNLAQTEASALRQRLVEFKEGIPALKEATERAKHYRGLCQEKSNEIEDLNLKLTLLHSEFEELERKVQRREDDLSQTTRNLQSEKTARENAYLKLDDAKLALAKETEKLVLKTSELSLKVAEINALDKEILSQKRRSKLLFLASSFQKLRLSEKDEIIKQKDEELEKKNEEIALLQAQVSDLKLKAEPLPHIQEWVASPAFQKICKLKAKKECVTMASHLRYKLHQSYPEVDLNRFRLFPDERILVNGISMLRDFTAPPHPFLSSWPEAQQQKAFQKTLKDWKKYDDGHCFNNELPLPAEKYPLFQAELEAYNARQERIKKCRAAGIEYDSDAEEVEPSPTNGSKDKGKQVSDQVTEDDNAEDHVPLSEIAKKSV